MTFGRLLLRNLVFHRRGNLAVLLGVAVGTAVLTGALLVGDSLRARLRARARVQLGNGNGVMVAGRFFHGDLGSRLEPRPPGGTWNVCAGLILHGSISAGDQRLSGVTIVETEMADTLFGDPSIETRFAEPWRPWHALP